MKTEQLIITVFAEDRPGIVRALSDAILSHKGNWLESSLSRLCGQFAGIIHLGVPAWNKSDLVTQLENLATEGIKVTVQSNVVSVDMESEHDKNVIDIVVEANDRAGIVEEIASVLAQAKANVEHMETECVSASMAGYDLFRAYVEVSLPVGLEISQLEEFLEEVSDDLVVNVVM